MPGDRRMFELPVPGRMSCVLDGILLAFPSVFRGGVLGRAPFLMLIWLLLGLLLLLLLVFPITLFSLLLLLPPFGVLLVLLLLALAVFLEGVLLPTDVLASPAPEDLLAPIADGEASPSGR